MGTRKHFRPEREQLATEWSQLAAYIDGEGCIIITHSPAKDKPHWNPHFSLVVQVTNSDMRLLVWCKKTFGGFITNKKRKVCKALGKRPLFHWHVVSGDAEWVLKNCLPYFIIKKEQAEVGIAFRESFPTVKYGKGYRVPSNVIEYRKTLKSKLSELKQSVPDIDTA